MPANPGLVWKRLAFLAFIQSNLGLECVQPLRCTAEEAQSF